MLRTANGELEEPEEPVEDDAAPVDAAREVEPAPAPAPVELADEVLAVDALVVPVPATVSPTSPDSETIVPSSGAYSFVFWTAFSSLSIVSLSLLTVALAEARLASRVAALWVDPDVLVPGWVDPEELVLCPLPLVGEPLDPLPVVALPVDVELLFGLVGGGDVVVVGDVVLVVVVVVRGAVVVVVDPVGAATLLA